VTEASSSQREDASAVGDKAEVQEGVAKTTREQSRLDAAAQPTVSKSEGIPHDEKIKEESRNGIEVNVAKKSSAPGQVGGAAILAKLRAAKAYKAPKPKPMVVLYGSQTGTAAEVAKNISAAIEGTGLPSRVLSMNEFGFENLSKDKSPYVIWVASSTGDGEAPDNASKFYTSAKKRSNPESLLQGVQFTCLGLGDSNYTRFMHIPRVLKTQFLELGATTFYDPVEADEVDGIEDIIDKWMEDLLPAVKKLMKPEEKQGGGVPMVQDKRSVMPLPSCSIDVVWIDGQNFSDEDRKVLKGKGYSADDPCHVKLKSAEYLTSEESHKEGRRVIHLEMGIENSGLQYKPGDCVGVFPENDQELVAAVIKHLGLDKDAWFEVKHKDEGIDTPETKPLQHVKWPCSVESAFSHGLDLTSPPKKSLLRLLAEYCSDEKEKEKLMHLCSREGRADYMKSIIQAHYSFCDVLFDTKSCKPPFECLLDALPPLAPRMYSISGCQAVSPDAIEVAFTVVEYESNGRTRKGVATTWLEKEAHALLHQREMNNNIQKNIPVYLRNGGVFSPPADLTVPWILIGPGTGVSPFRGFLQDRQVRLEHHDGAIGDCVLFFGCRDIAKDFLYEKDLTSFKSNGTLSELFIAESRKSPLSKTYVQHLMLEQKDKLKDMILEKNGYVFVCGDGANMAKDVHNALVEIILSTDAARQEERQKSEDILSRMTKEGRYVRDVWS
jgi:NADPH-ferrihemoprotein reductase